MNYNFITEELERNRGVFIGLLQSLNREQYTWKPYPDKWCLLEIVCHLYDEEREDFRARIKHVLETPEESMPSINPSAWVKERNYMAQDYNTVLQKFLHERDESVKGLRSLAAPKWDNAYKHPRFGAMSAKMFFTNWLAHDYLHFKQITKLKYDYLSHISGEKLLYAGEWK